MNEAEDVAAQRSVDLVALDEVLTMLALLDPRKSKVVELRFFGGLSCDEIAEILNLSEDAVRQWEAYAHANYQQRLI